MNSVSPIEKKIREAQQRLYRTGEVDGAIKFSDISLRPVSNKAIEIYFDYILDCSEKKLDDTEWIEDRIREFIEAHESFDISYGIHNYGMMFLESIPRSELNSLKSEVQEIIESRKKLNDQLPSLLSDINDLLRYKW